MTLKPLKTKKKTPKTKPPASLRKRAESLLMKQKERLRELSAIDLKKLAHELGTYQIELEMQNDELRRAQGELESSRTKYADLYDFSPVGYFIFDKNGRIQEVNLTGSAMLGNAKRLLVNKPILSYIDPAHRTVFRNHLREVIGTGTGTSCEITLLKKDGSSFQAHLTSISVHTGEEGRGVCRTAVSDITERKQAEEALRKSEEQFRMLADSIPNLAWWANGDGYIIWYNRRWYEYTGTTPEQMEGWGWQSVHDPQVLPRVLERWKASIATGQPFDMEFPLRGADGAFRSFLTRVQPLKDSAGLVLRWFGTNTDISALKLAEEAIRDSEERFRTLFESARDAIFIIGAEGEQAGRIVDANRSAAEIHGYSVDELKGLRIMDLDSPEAAHEAPELIRKILQGEWIKKEIVHRRKDGSVFPCEISAGLLEYANHKYVLAFDRDITERKQTENALRSAHAELEQRAYELNVLNRELEAFAYTVSHDLKAPLRSIEGFSRAVVEDYNDKLDEPGRDYLRRVTSACQRMTQLIDAMLNMARLTRGELHEKVVDLSSLAQVVTHNLRKQDAGRQVEFIIAEKVKGNGDAAMLEVVLQNLLDNAWKFTSKHPSAKIEFGATDMGGKPVYFVRDDGAGFDMQYADKLFQPFKRMHRESEFPGLGIGLAIAHRIIMRHGGRMWAEGNVEKGVTVFFTL
jgi:PAS domain S-box-containing protein